MIFNRRLMYMPEVFTEGRVDWKKLLMNAMD